MYKYNIPTTMFILRTTLTPLTYFLQQKRKLHEMLVLEHDNVRLKDKQPKN